MKKIISTILKKLGFVKCEECGKWTTPSIVAGNICSMECWKRGNYVISEKPTSKEPED